MSYPDRLVEGKVVVITGAGGGIGRAIARLMAQQGAKVVINDLGTSVDGSGANPSLAERVAEEIRSEGGAAVANADSIASWDGAQRIVQTALDAFGCAKRHGVAVTLKVFTAEETGASHCQADNPGPGQAFVCDWLAAQLAPASCSQGNFMPDIQYIPPNSDFSMPPLSVAARIGDLVFVSGTHGYYQDGRIDEGDFGAQFDQAVVALREILARSGASMHSLVKVNVLLTRSEDVAEMNRRYAEAFGPAPYPARTTCVVAALPDPRMLLEIECVAAANQG